MTEVRDAIQKALEFAERQVYGTKLDEPRVEEVESVDDKWFVTLSFNLPGVSKSIGAVRLSGTDLDRQYKIFEIDKTNGQVTKMRIRELGAKRW